MCQLPYFLIVASVLVMLAVWGDRWLVSMGVSKVCHGSSCQLRGFGVGLNGRKLTINIRGVTITLTLLF